MKLSKAVNLAIANITSEGLDDVLPKPFEIDLLKSNPGLKKELELLVGKRLDSALKSSPKKIQEALDKLELIPIEHVLVPKKEAFDFRKIAIIRPEDLLIYQSIAFMIGEPFEKARSSVARGRIFSYRFRPLLGKGQIFDPKYNLRSFQRASKIKSKREMVNYIVKCDISNFYDRINIHRIESTLLSMNGVDTSYAKIINQILLHWARRDSYGLPVGCNGSRILSEVSLFNIDSSLKESGINFIRFVDDFRIFTRTASEAHAALAMLINFLNREGLFINTQKTSIERVDATGADKNGDDPEEHVAETVAFREFRIRAAYGGTIPIKFRMPAKKSQQKYSSFDIDDAIKRISSEDFAQPGQIKDILYAIIVQEEYEKLNESIEIVEKFPQFYSLLVDILKKNSEHIAEEERNNISNKFSVKIKDSKFLPEFTAASLVSLVGDINYFNRDTIMGVIRSMRRNEGTYYGMVVFEAALNLNQRIDALEIRDYFNRSNEWEKRRIIRIMAKILPNDEYRAWRRAVRSTISRDPFASAIK